jgi:2-oxoglutarate dehydrogenase E1 component
LAFGSLVLERHPVRLSGQDSRRGTFSQRHAVFFDRNTGGPHFPLNAISPDQARFVAYDSPLSETAVLGFDFGYSLDSPNTLVLWEAQFGDFVNGAQPIIDQFIVSSESKWQRASGLVMLLPHGYEGQGPEHSSARLERFLLLCAEENIQVCVPSTPAQYFHLLRRQLKRNFRKPLIVITPKSLLRHKEAVSPIEDLTEGGFREVLDDAALPADGVRRVVLCSGKIYYGLLEQRKKDDNSEVALLRVEQFYPFPAGLLRQALTRYRSAKQWIWAQEEPKNMGGWIFMEPRLRELGWQLTYVGRPATASPATASYRVHLREQAELIQKAIGSEASPMREVSPNDKKIPDIVREEVKTATLSD